MQNCIYDILITHVMTVPPDLYDHCSACIRCSSGAEALVADSSEENGHSGELRTRDPTFVSYREGENYKENG